MKRNLIENIERKYGIRVLKEYKNDNREDFLMCLDVEDEEKFTLKVLPGEYLTMTFKRIYGER